MKKSFFDGSRTAVAEKSREALHSVLPILLIVLLICLSITPVETDLMFSFLIGTVMVVLGMGLFSLGADTSMTPI